MLDGRQYVVVGAGDSLYSFYLQQGSALGKAEKKDE